MPRSECPKVADTLAARVKLAEGDVLRALGGAGFSVPGLQIQV